MKTTILRKWTLGLSLAVVPFLGCGQRAPATNAAPAIVQNTTVIAPAETDAEAATEEAESQLENAPAQVVARGAVPTNSISPAAAEIVKLAQAGVDESVMMAFITNSANAFNLSSDNIVYLNDVGVPSGVVATMIQRDRDLGLTAAVAAPAASAPTAPYTNQLVPAPGAPVPYATTLPTETQAEPPPPVEQQPVPVPQPQQVNVTYTYFYDSLAPYGTWVDVDGYGLCWQPTVVVVNRDWQPYVHHGRWVYTDCGWYWASDYSWGWAPFHYGRWFRHSRLGWCWAPDTVWGPAWVSWRYSSDYCGWAPLPPSACYRPGLGFTYYGRSVGFSFGFGLSWDRYCFVPVRNFCDRQVYHHRLTHHHGRTVYHNTRPIHRYDRDDRNRIINRGIPVERVRAVTRTDIRPVPTRDTDRPMAPRFERGERDNVTRLAVYRPQLPEPQGTPRLVGEGVRPADRTPVRNVSTAGPGRHNLGASPSGQEPAPMRITPRVNDRRIVTAPSTTPAVPATPSGPRTDGAVTSQPVPDVRSGNPGRNLQAPRIIGEDARPGGHRTEPLILRGPSRSVGNGRTPDAVQTPAAPAIPATPGGSGTAATPATPATPAAPSAVSDGNQNDNRGRVITRTPDRVRTVQPWNSGAGAQPAVPTRQAPLVQPPVTPQPQQPQITQPPIERPTYRTESPRLNDRRMEAPRVITPNPSAPIERQQPAPVSPQSPPRVYQPSAPSYQRNVPSQQPSAPAYQPPRQIEQPRYNAPERRMPSRSEMPVRNIEPRQQPSVQQSAPAPAQREVRSAPQREAPSRGDNRRNR